MSDFETLETLGDGSASEGSHSEHNPEEEEPVVRLRDGVDLRDLQGDGVSFEISDADFGDGAPTNTYFPDEAYRVYCEDMMDDNNSDSNNECEHDVGEEFTSYSKRMTEVTEDGGVKKLILRPGAGPVVPERSLVTVHYNGYLETGDEPFDSTRARAKPLTFYLGSGEVMPGLDVAVSTMKKGEQAKFIIQHQYFLGDRGCPPRIPEKATCLFVIEMLKFVECAGVDEFYRMTVHDRKEVGFDLIKKVVQKERDEGKSYFNDNNYYKANMSFKKAVKYLEDYHLKDEPEEKEQQKILLALYQNLSLCNLNLSHCGSAILYANQALRIGNTAKALFLKGKALRKQADFDRARTCLQQAQKLARQDKSIASELKKLDDDFRRFQQKEKDFCQKIFKTSSCNPEEANKENMGGKRPNVSIDACTQEFRSLIQENLQEIKSDDSIIETPFPASGFSEEELACIELEAMDLGMTVSRKQVDRNVELIIRKPNPN